WFQITSDLVILTGLVYLIGSTTTVVSFTYLFHITMACIFFGRRDSFIVTLLSALLFLTMVVAQCMGLIPRAGILVPGACGPTDVLPTAIFAVPTVFVWLIVWYLVSSLSNKVRQRDRDLDTANHRLIRADEEINLQMLRVAHDLKAPFSGIESNIQVLKQLHWDEMTENVRQLISKIDGRSANLRARIGDILMLGSLRSAQEDKSVVKQVQLREMLEAVLSDVKGQAEAKNVSLVLGEGRMSVLGDQEQLKILFANLVSNAIVYSHEGGIVDIRLDDETTGVRVSITDNGIGISDQALPRIFEDFFRAQEAATFNPSSTGLGLAIVRQVANNLRLKVFVESEKDKGSVFQVVFPPG
ncbi:MAG: HAMP domain-containing sensor histidine kinase, partial [bacterium]